MGTFQYSAGDVIVSKYRLTELLGEGGMGAVWRAQNVTLEVDVAIKLLRRERADPRLWELLLTEARTTARLGHRAIVRVFDFGETDRGDPFVVMEYLTGPLLADILDRSERVSVEDAIRILLPIASALAAAHEKGVIHRDVKPENILLATDGKKRVSPKLIDFGVAKLELEVEEAFDTTTGERALVGTPAYMSPEQAAGRSAIDERTDVWAFCVMFYELLTGARPWTQRDIPDLIEAIQKEPAKPITDFGVGDEALWKMLERGLSKDPEERWRTMSELGRGLAAWAVDHGIDADFGGTSIASEWLETEGAAHGEALLPAGIDYVRFPLRKRLLLVDEETPGEIAREGPVSQQSVPPTRVSISMLRPKRNVLSAVALGVIVAAVVLAQDARRGDPTRATALGAPAPAAAVPVAPVPAAHLDATKAVASTEAREVERVSIASCFARLVPESGLESAGDLEAVCDERNPRHGADRIKTELVRAGGGRVSEGMRQWALLGWYEMAAFAAMQGACCPTSEAFTLPGSVGSCVPLGDALGAIAAAVRERRDPGEAIRGYTASVHCALASGVAAAFPYGNGPRDGEETAFRRVASRALGEEIVAAPSASAPPHRPAAPATAASAASSAKDDYE